MQPTNPMVLVFALIAIVRLRRSVEAAAVDVFLPVLLLVPSVFSLHIPHLPSLSCVDAVLLPIGIAALISRSQRWQFKRADLWVVLFVLASCYTDYINIGLVNALYNLPSLICDSLCAYFIGKLLIEQSGLRERFAQRLVFLLAIVSFFSIGEFVGRKNIFLMLARRFFRSNMYWMDQIRGGFMRVKGPFAGAEQAGIVFFLGLLISLWLWFVNRSRQDVDEKKYLGIRRSTLWVVSISLGLYMTLSRGPWLGAAAGFLVARIGLVKNRRRAIIAALVLCVLGGIAANTKANQYAQLNPDDTAGNESQSSAYYRTQLDRVYKSVAERGGLFGWSAAAYPRDPAYDSIDNEYLLLWVTQGKVGLWLFILIALEGGIAIALAIYGSRQSVDSCFYYCLGGTLGGLILVLTTVYLTSQGFVLFFLFIGWSQSLREQYEGVQAAPERLNSRFAFRRVLA
jgi:hypothetical protein